MRLPDWKARLFAYLTRSARQPYLIGTHDCALFAAGAVEAVAGHDPAAAWRGRYTTLQGGLKRLRAAGQADYIVATAQALPEIHPSEAAAGDIAAVEDTASGSMVLGVVQGEMIYVLREDGLGLVSRALMRRAFRT